MISLHLARADNGVIGADGTIPWHIPGEQRRFKAMTMGRPMIMGRKTFESFPSLLPGRRHIVLTRNLHWQATGAELAHDVTQALAIAGDDVAVIGGVDIFALLIDQATLIELTEVHLSPAGDAVVPPFTGWRETARTDFPPEGAVPGYSYVTLARH